MRERYIQADIREDALLAGIVRTEHIKYVLAASALGVILFILPFPMLLRFFFLLSIPGMTTIALFLRLDQAIFRWRKYRKITNRVPLELLKDYKPPALEDVEISYESGARGILLAVDTVSREMLSDGELDWHADLWSQLCGQLHREGITVLQITDWMVPPSQPELDYLESKYRERYSFSSGSTDNLLKALGRVDYYRSLALPQSHYYVLLLTWNPKTDLAKVAKWVSSFGGRLGLSFEVLSARTAIKLSEIQIAPFGERSSIDEEITEDPKLLQLVKIWANTINDMKSSRDNRLVQRRKRLRKENEN